jgi:uncharacterized protein (TIGR03086 family)
MTHTYNEVVTEADLSSIYARLAAGFCARLENCPPDRWTSPSPCEEWTARDVALHLIGSHRGLLGLPPLELDPNADLAPAWREASAAMAAALADTEARAKKPGGPFGESTLEMLAGGLLVTDTLVHTWDFARATSQDEALDAEAVSMSFEWLRGLGDRIRRPGGFHAPVEPPPNADQQTAYICYTGRLG